MSASNKLLDGLKEIGIPENKITDLADKMDKYIGEIILFNSAYNLVNTSDYDEIVTNHILDSLSAWKELVALANQIEQQQSIKFADIGSGGGLPGIPLAAAMPENPVWSMPSPASKLPSCPM